MIHAEPAVFDEERMAFFARLVADHCNDSIVVTGVDGCVEWVNAAFIRATGYTLSDMRGQKPGKILQGADTDDATVREISDALARRVPLRTEILNYTKQGAPYWVEMHISPVFSDEGHHTHFIAVERDITKRRELEDRTAAVFEAESYQQAERNLLAQMSEWLYAAKSLSELLEVVGLSMQTLMPEADGALYTYAQDRDVLERTVHWGDAVMPGHLEADSCWALRRGRAYFYGSQAIQLPCGHYASKDVPSFCLPVIAHGETIGLLHLSFGALAASGTTTPAPHDEFLRQRWAVALTCAEQISLAIANVQLRQELEERSMRDQLTGLWNRRQFLQSGAHEVRRGLETGQPFSLIVLDIDFFKNVNDTFGHDAGDLVLRDVAQTLLDLTGPEATPCRLGGEEFVLIVPGADVDRAFDIAERARSEIARLETRVDDRILPGVTVSAGIAAFPTHGASIPTLLKEADMALYAAKAGGRDQSIIARSGRAQRAGSHAAADHTENDAREMFVGDPPPKKVSPSAPSNGAKPPQKRARRAVRRGGAEAS